MLLGRIFSSKEPGQRGNSFWIEAMAEFVLVVIGILLALQIDNWNQERQDRELERVLLGEMISNLQSDLTDVEINIAIDQNLIQSSNIVIDYLTDDRPYHDSLNAYFARADLGTIFLANTSAFESMESIGIDLIRNDSLRQQITYLYSALYNYLRKMEDIVINNTLNVLNPQLSRLVRPIEPYQNAVPLNPSGIKKDNVLLSAMTTNVQLIEIQINGYRMAKERINKLINDIEIELNQ